MTTPTEDEVQAAIQTMIAECPGPDACRLTEADGTPRHPLASSICDAHRHAYEVISADMIAFEPKPD
jgi:hypothetical protein